MDSQVALFCNLIAEVIRRNFGEMLETGTVHDLTEVTAESINRAFLASLVHAGTFSTDKGRSFLEEHAREALWENTIKFYLQGLDLWKPEFTRYLDSHPEVSDALKIQNNNRLSELSSDALRNILFSIMFPEGRGLQTESQREQAVDDLRHRRGITIINLNPDPIRNPGKEILFTSNILVTTPFSGTVAMSRRIQELLSACEKEVQLYWYDHPVPIGVPVEQNEAIYGLRALDNALDYEILHGQMDPSVKATCVLSASTTHQGLQNIVIPYLEEEFEKLPPIQHIDVYIFTEATTRQLIKDILEPMARNYFPEADSAKLYDIIGVDGEYGRHYSFLKACAVLWKVFINPELKATFKIDLDQVFPQEQLVKETGESAFGHFKTALWGAHGEDYWGNDVDLSMLAGTLVNESDIHRSLFTPDVTYPGNTPKADECIFHSRLPQALSTEAEMMMRYQHDLPRHSETKVLQRVHVTGGTNGILIKALRKYRPFTPSIIGRAEDQAYLLSVLMEGQTKLRYLHKPGLIMRHDKEAFAMDAIKAASTGKLIGDYIRILLFSSYAGALPWSMDQIKEQIDPFTGCFVTPVPVTVVYLRFALRAAELFKNGDMKEGSDFVTFGSRRLMKMIDFLYRQANPIFTLYREEKKAWNLFYDALHEFENDPAYPDRDMVIKRFRAIAEEARIKYNH